MEGETMKIAATFSFEAAHRLPRLPEGHKCKNLHGHNYVLEVAVEGPLDERGFVMDYAELERRYYTCQTHLSAKLGGHGE